jgi:hypothetical protein
LITGARSAVVPIGEKFFTSHSVVGGGCSIAGNYELFHNFLFLLNAFWAEGGSHYLVSDGPQIVLRPNAAGTDIFPSMVHTGAGLAGFEWSASKSPHSPSTTDKIISGEISSRTPRILPLRARSSDMVGLARRTPTTASFRNTPSIGYRPSGSPISTERSSITRSIRM